MATREEKIAFLQSQATSSAAPTREQKIAFLQAKASAPPSADQPANTGQAQTALEGFGNGAAMGYLPQMQAAVETGVNKLGDLKDKALQTIGLDQLTSIDAQLRKQGFKLPESSYVQARDENIARQSAQANANPNTAMASTVAGGVVSGIPVAAALPVAGPAATTMGRVGQAVLQGTKAGAILGAVANPGDTQGQVSPIQAPERIMNAGKGAAVGGATAMAASVPGLVKGGANAAKNAIADKLGQDVEFTPIANKDAVEAAAKKLGIDSVPRGVMTSNPTFQKLESGLAQSGSLPAKGIRDQYNTFFKGIDDASEKIAALKTTDSDFAIGKNIQSDLTDQVNAKRAPVSEMYKALTPTLKKVEVDQGVVNKAFGALRRNPLFQTLDGKAMLDEYQAAARSQPELASLKEWRSTLSDSVGPGSTPLEAKRIDAIRGAVTSIRDNSINAVKESLPAKWVNKRGSLDDLIDQVALADSAHASNINEINSVKSIVGNKDFKSPTTFVSKIGDMKEADLAQKAGNLDVSSLKSLQEKFPSVFEKAKTAKVNDLIQSSTNPVSGFNDARFIKQYDGMDQELKDLIFDPKVQSHIEAFKTLKQALPEKLGPSGTPEGQMMMDMFNPKRNALDYGIKKTLDATANKGAASAASSGSSGTYVSRTVSPLLRLVSAPQNQAASLQSVAEAKPTKGPEKWAADGLQKLEDHGVDKETLDKAKGAAAEDSKVKQLLISASDLKPGSKAMDALLVKLKAKDGR